MPIESYINEIALLSAILLTSFSQLLLRIGARHKKKKEILINKATISGYLLFLIVVLLTIFAMQKIELKTAMAWSASTYILTPTISYILIKETLNIRMIFGSAIIVIGLLIFII